MIEQPHARTDMLLMYLYYATTRLAHYLYVQHNYAQIQPLSHTSCARKCGHHHHVAATCALMACSSRKIATMASGLAPVSHNDSNKAIDDRSNPASRIVLIR